MRPWRESPPDAFVIDLSRLPSHGREIAIALRQSPATRRIPIVFCDGAEEKVKRIQAELPDAVYCSTATLRSALKRAIAKPPNDPVKPTRMMDRYASRTVAQKLGIKEYSSIALIDAPRDYIKVFGELPAGVRFSRMPASICRRYALLRARPSFFTARRFPRSRARRRHQTMDCVAKEGLASRRYGDGASGS